MPTNNRTINHLWNGKPNGERFSEEVLNSNLKDIDPGKIDVAEVNASKELGRLAVFIMRNFPKQVGQNKKPVDIVIDLLTVGREFQNIGQIRTETAEGKLLFAALVTLTQSPDIRINGLTRSGSNMTPDEVLHALIEVVKKNNF